MAKIGGFNAAVYDKFTQTSSNTTDSITGNIGNVANTTIKLPKKIALIYSDAKREYFPTQSLYETEIDVYHECENIAKYLHKMGIETVLVPGSKELPDLILANKPDMILNFAGSVRGDEALACTIPAFLRLIDIPSNGSDPLFEAITYNKYLTKKFLKSNNLPTPECQLFFNENDPLDSNLKFPLFSKLNEVHGSVDITEDAVSENEESLRKRIKFLLDRYHQPVLVEEYIDGDEVTGVVLENAPRQVFLSKKVFPGTKKYNIVTFDDQWDKDMPDYLQLDEIQYANPEIEDMVLKAFHVYKMADIGKIDIRVDKNGRPFIVDLATSPCFTAPEDQCAYAYIIGLYGISFEEILERFIINVQNRYLARRKVLN